MTAVLASKKGKGPEKVMEFLDEAIEHHFMGLKVRHRTAQS